MNKIADKIYEEQLNLKNTFEALGERNFHQYFGEKISKNKWVRTRANTLAA